MSLGLLLIRAFWIPRRLTRLPGPKPPSRDPMCSFRILGLAWFGSYDCNGDWQFEKQESYDES